MPYQEFSGELDGENKQTFVAFDGELDPPKKRTWGEALMDTGRSAASGVSAVGDELGKLRDSFFTGVDNTRAATNAVGAGAQASQLQKTNDRLAELMSYGEGDSAEAQGLRKTAEHYTKRMPTMISSMTEAQADAQRGAQMTTRPAVAAMGEAKTFGDAWEIFKQHPYDVIAGVTATSLPTMLPALATGAVLGPGAGALAMGGSSAITEAGSSLAEFARDKGINTTDPKAVEAFFSDRQNLADAMSYAGKRAGIIGTLDAASGGIAGKTIAPAFKSMLAKQAVNMPAQMAVQAGLGAAGEAGGQLATKGRIDQPGQVLMEAVGELAGAPLEVAAFSKDAFKAATKPAPQPTPEAPPAAPQPTPQDVLAAGSVDEAIATASAAISTPPADLLGAQAQNANQGFLGVARETQAQNQTDAADLADLTQSETRNLQVMRAQIEQDQAKAAELEQIRAQSVETLGRLPDQQVASAMAATDEAPTAMQLAMQKALTARAAPVESVAPTATESVAPAPVPVSDVIEPRLVERQPGMMAMPQKLAQQRAAANPALEAVRIQNQNGKFAYTVIPRTADVSQPTAIQPGPGGTDQRGIAEPRPSLATGVGPGSDTGTAVVARGDGNLPSSGPVLSADQPAAVDQRLIPVSKREASRENAAKAPQEARASTEPVAAVPATGNATLPTVTQEKPDGLEAEKTVSEKSGRKEAQPVPVIAQPAASAGLAAAPEAVGQGVGPAGKVVSTYTGKYSKGMGKEAARAEAQRLNRTSDKNVTYAAEEHGDAKLENPWAVVGRKVVKSTNGANSLSDTGRSQTVAREQSTSAADRDGQRGALLPDAPMAAADVGGAGSARAVPEVANGQQANTETVGAGRGGLLWTGRTAEPGNGADSDQSRSAAPSKADADGQPTSVQSIDAAKPDDLADIDPASLRKLMKRVKVDHQVLDDVSGEGGYVTQEVTAAESLKSIDEDLTNYKALLKCMKG